MVYFQDIYFVIIILIFKLGVVLENFSSYDKYYKFTLVFFILSSFFYIFFIIFQSFKKKNLQEKAEVEQIENQYKDKLFLTTESR